LSHGSEIGGPLWRGSSSLLVERAEPVAAPDRGRVVCFAPFTGLFVAAVGFAAGQVSFMFGNSWRTPMTRSLLVLGLVAASLAQPLWSPVLLVATAQEKTDQDLIQGAWKCVTLERQGKVNKGPFIGEKWVFKGKEVIVYHEDKVRAQGTFVLDPEKKPKTITITGTDGDLQGKTVLGIYRIEKNTLTLCNDVNGDERPKEFSGAGKPLLLTFERMKSE